MLLDASKVMHENYKTPAPLLYKEYDVLESMDFFKVMLPYGDRNHKSFEQSKEELLQAIEYATGRGGNVIIPCAKRIPRREKTSGNKHNKAL